MDVRGSGEVITQGFQKIWMELYWGVGLGEEMLQWIGGKKGINFGAMRESYLKKVFVNLLIYYQVIKLISIFFLICDIKRTP